MIIHHGHEVQEIYRQGRKVKAVIRKGKRVFGIEPVDILDINAINAYANFSQYLTLIKGFDMSNTIVSNSDKNYLISPTTSPYPAYAQLFQVDDGYILMCNSRYFGDNTRIKLNSIMSLFRGCENLTNVDLSKFSTENCVNFADIFHGCLNLKSLEVNHFDTSNSTSFRTCFYNCITLTSLDISCWNTSKALSLYGMFSRCLKIEVLDLKNFNTAIVTDFGHLFYQCRALRVLDISTFDMQSAVNVEGFFFECRSLSIIKTPFRTAPMQIELPTTFYNADGSEYGNVIPANSVGSVTIYRTRELAQQHNPELFT